MLAARHCTLLCYNLNFHVTHNDAGKVRPGKDVVLMVSHSGNTQECVLAAKQLLARGITTVAITGSEGIMCCSSASG